jgi:hypothetical protein
MVLVGDGRARRDAWDATFDAGPVAARHNLSLTSLDQFIADRLYR